MTGKEELIRKLLGSPVLVSSLTGVEHEVAITAYGQSIRGLFYAGAGLSAIAALVQAGTGWKEGAEAEKEEEERFEEEDVNGIA